MFRINHGLGQIVDDFGPRPLIPVARWIAWLPSMDSDSGKEYLLTLPELDAAVAAMKTKFKLTDKQMFANGYYNLALAVRDKGADPNSTRRKDYSRGRAVTYFPSPQNIVDLFGLCETIRLTYGKGQIGTSKLIIPGLYGPVVIEPGVFHPWKTWARMASESESIRAGREPKWFLLVAGATAHQDKAIEAWSTKPGAGSFAIFRRTPRDSFDDEAVICMPTDATVKDWWTADIPNTYHATGVATAMWLASENKSTIKVGVVGTNGPPVQTDLMDPKWKHAVKVTTARNAVINPDGTVQWNVISNQGSLLKVHRKLPAGQSGSAWVSRSAAWLDRQMNIKVPNPAEWDGPAEWIDDGSKFSIFDLQSQHKKPPPKVGLIAAAAAAVGVAALVYTSVKG